MGRDIRYAIVCLVLSGGLCACHHQKAALEQNYQPPAAAKAVHAAPATPAPSARIGEKDSLGCTWVEAEATVTVGEQETRAQIRAAAMEKAREAAMRDLLGVEVNQRSLDFQQEGLRGQNSLIESILRTTRRGCILKESVLADEYRDLGTCRQCAFFVRLRACIKERAGDADKDFRVELALSRDRFVEGDEAKIAATASRDAYLYVYDVGMNSETSLIVPNDILPEIKVPAGQAWEYPDEQAAKRGVHLVAQMPAGKVPVSAEVVRVVATKTPLPRKVYDPAAGGYLGVMQRLNASAYEWAEDAAAFAIYPAKGK